MILFGYTCIDGAGRHLPLRLVRHVGECRRRARRPRSCADRAPYIVYAQKFYEHLWPVAVLLVDKALNHAALVRVYAGARRLRRRCRYGWLSAVRLDLGAVRAHAKGTSGIAVYQQQPVEFTTA